MNERDLFIGALQRPEPTQREAYLERECAGDAALRRRVEVLLGAHAEAGGILKAPFLLVDPTDQTAPPPPTDGTRSPSSPGHPSTQPFTDEFGTSSSADLRHLRRAGQLAVPHEPTWKPDRRMNPLGNTLRDREFHDAVPTRRDGDQLQHAIQEGPDPEWGISGRGTRPRIGTWRAGFPRGPHHLEVPEEDSQMAGPSPLVGAGMAR
jgi:hypothetical protein